VCIEGRGLRSASGYSTSRTQNDKKISPQSTKHSQKLRAAIQQFTIAFWAPSLKLVVKEYNISLHERFERKRQEFGAVYILDEDLFWGCRVADWRRKNLLEGK
jgi:hypothetical protein